MFCSGCGHVLQPGQPVCPQCGRPMMAPPPSPVPNLAFEVGNYSNRIRALSTVWFIYGALTLVTGIAGLTFARAFFTNGFAPWMHGPWSRGGDMPFGPGFGSAILHFAWIMLSVRAALAFIAGWGLMERAPWGRVVAIVAAFFCLLKIPFGTAIGIWTLVSLLGYRNSTLYDQL